MGQRHDDGSLTVLVWCSTFDQTKRDGDPALARRIRLQLTGTEAGRATVTRLDRDHGDVTTLAEQLGISEWPADDEWDKLRTVDRLASVDVDMSAAAGASVIELDVPQPGAVLIEVAAP